MGKGSDARVFDAHRRIQPMAVAERHHRGSFEAFVERTSFRVRVLTKNAIVGSQRWIDFFASRPGRFVVGLSTGNG